MVNTFKHTFSKNCVTALLGATLALTPALAFARPSEMATQADTNIAQVQEGDTTTATTNAEDGAAALLGLSDAERAELKGLQDKLENYWALSDTVVLEGELTDQEWERMSELEGKAWRAKVTEALPTDEASELEALWAKLDALKEDEDLTEREWDRLWELEEKATGSDEACGGAWCDCEATSSDEYVKSLKGLTDAERRELKALKDKSDAYWKAWDSFYEAEGLSDAEWDRMNELEQKSRLAKLQTYLSKDEFAEFKGLYDKLDQELELSDAEWDRYVELEDKATLAEMEGCLDAGDFAEYKGLHDKLDREDDLTDAEWDRYCELESKGEDAQGGRYF